jgi:hypothetical protein
MSLITRLEPAQFPEVSLVLLLYPDDARAESESPNLQP